MRLGDGDSELAARLSQELTDHNTRATGVDDERGLSVQVRNAEGALVAGLRGRLPGVRPSEGIPTTGSADVHMVKALT